MPVGAFAILFFVVPIGVAIMTSLSSWPGVGSLDFVGGRNYLTLAADKDFFHSIAISLTYAATSAVGITVISTILAAAVSSNMRGSKFYRVVWFIPAVAPSAAVAVYWNTAFQPQFGAFNALLKALGLPSSIAVLAEPGPALTAAIFVTVWSGVSFAFLLILGGMEQVPVAVYEAARLDGAGPLRMFFSVTLPIIRPVVAVVGTLQLVGAFNNFSTIYGLTGGGPGAATQTVPILVYNTAFVFSDYGLAAAMSVVAGVVLIAIGSAAMLLTSSSQNSVAK